MSPLNNTCLGDWPNWRERVTTKAGREKRVPTAAMLYYTE
jgi:hypothetical protein